MRGTTPDPPPTSLLEVAGRFARPLTAPASAGLRGARQLMGEIPAILRPSFAVEALTTAWQAGQVADKLLLGHNPVSPLSGPPGRRNRRIGKTADAWSAVFVDSTPERIRTAVTALRGRRPRPLDDGAGCRVGYRLARGGGLEPPMTGPEPVVLPITPPPKVRSG